MMRVLKIPDLTYEQYNAIRNTIPILQMPPPREPDTEQPLTKKNGQIHRQFTYFCESFKIWYVMDSFLKINYPICQNPLKLAHPISYFLNL
jgi:hypothetical protein